MNFLFYLVTCFLLLNVSGNEQSLLQDSCKKAAAKNRKLKIDFCLKSLEGCPQCKTAKNLSELLKASIKYAETKIESVKESMKKNFRANKYPKDTDMQVMECLSLYSGAASSMYWAMKTFKKRDYKNVTMYMNEGIDNLNACDEGYKERSTPRISPFIRNNEFLTHTIQIPLAFTDMLKTK